MELSEVKLGEEIGRGGLASVHLAQHGDKTFAVKIWRKQVALSQTETPRDRRFWSIFPFSTRDFWGSLF